jgi:hypothetical protein
MEGHTRLVVLEEVIVFLAQLQHLAALGEVSHNPSYMEQEPVEMALMEK